MKTSRAFFSEVERRFDTMPFTLRYLLLFVTSPRVQLDSACSYSPCSRCLSLRGGSFCCFTLGLAVLEPSSGRRKDVRGLSRNPRLSLRIGESPVPCVAGGEPGVVAKIKRRGVEAVPVCSVRRRGSSSQFLHMIYSQNKEAMST